MCHCSVERSTGNECKRYFRFIIKAWHAIALDVWSFCRLHALLELSQDQFLDLATRNPLFHCFPESASLVDKYQLPRHPIHPLLLSLSLRYAFPHRICSWFGDRLGQDNGGLRSKLDRGRYLTVDMGGLLPNIAVHSTARYPVVHHGAPCSDCPGTPHGDSSGYRTSCVEAMR